MPAVHGSYGIHTEQLGCMPPFHGGRTREPPPLVIPGSAEKVNGPREYRND
jgi:hypothetical protein